MALELDHLFVFVDDTGEEAARLERSGLVASFERRHPGQGTTNRCYCFDNAFLELIRVCAPEEMTGEAVRRTRLAERANWRRTGASPFGIAVRHEANVQLPFEIWDYAAPFLPAGVIIKVATDSDDIRQPFIFSFPGSSRPDRWTDGRDGQRQLPAGLATIGTIEMALAKDVPPASALQSLVGAGVVKLLPVQDAPRATLALFSRGDRPRVALTLLAGV